MTWPDVHYKKLTVPAWEVCELCDGLGPAKPEGCGMCRSEGGKWHEAVEPMATVSIENDPIITSRDPLVTKSTILFQLYDPCVECGGKKVVKCLHGEAYDNGKYDDGSKPPGIRPHPICNHPCPHCLKDSDGSPTGAAEGSGQGWEVEK